MPLPNLPSSILPMEANEFNYNRQLMSVTLTVSLCLSMSKHYFYPYQFIHSIVVVLPIFKLSIIGLDYCTI